MPKAIILAPTRELACQIHTESKKLCHNSDMKTVVVYGGSDIRAQLSELSTGCDMIVATPGRLNDLVDRGVVSFCKVIFLVLDEADRMLDMGFEVTNVLILIYSPSFHFLEHLYSPSSGFSDLIVIIFHIIATSAPDSPNCARKRHAFEGHQTDFFVFSNIS